MRYIFLTPKRVMYLFCFTFLISGLDYAVHRFPFLCVATLVCLSHCPFAWEIDSSEITKSILNLTIHTQVPITALHATVISFLLTVLRNKLSVAYLFSPPSEVPRNNSLTLCRRTPAYITFSPSTRLAARCPPSDAGQHLRRRCAFRHISSTGFFFFL